MSLLSPRTVVNWWPWGSPLGVTAAGDMGGWDPLCFPVDTSPEKSMKFPGCLYQYGEPRTCYSSFCWEVIPPPNSDDVTSLLWLAPGSLPECPRGGVGLDRPGLPQFWLLEAWLNTSSCQAVSLRLAGLSHFGCARENGSAAAPAVCGCAAGSETPCLGPARLGHTDASKKS